MGAPRVWQRVLKVLREAPGVTLYKTEVAERAGLDVEQVYGAMNTILRNSDEAPFIDVIHKGAAWRYAPKGAVHTKDSVKQRALTQGITSESMPQSSGHTTRVFEEVGKTKNGVLLRDNDGNMWRAEAL